MNPTDTLLTFSPGALTMPLLVALVIAACALVGRGLLTPFLARIGLRNAPRRLLRAALIVFGLMLATTFVASSLAVDDTITLAVRTVAVYNLGRVDEDVTGGTGPLNTFEQEDAGLVIESLGGNPKVAGVAPALVVPNTLVADDSAREVRGGITAMGLQPAHAGALGALTDTTTGAPQPLQALGAHEVYLNGALANTLNAHVGDTVTLYSVAWQGSRYSFHVRAIVKGGPLGDSPAIIMSLAALQQVASQPDSINHIYIANAGNGLTGVGYSDAISRTVNDHLPGDLQVSKVKQNGVTFALQAQQLFGRILTLYTLFAFAIGLLLIFLIFTLLAAERRSELGVARALGMRRSQVVWMLLFEGAAYDVAAALVGVLAGLGLGAGILSIVSPTLKRIGFPIQFALEPTSMFVAFALGLLFTLLTIIAAAWTVSRMTIAAALRDLPEPPPAAPSLLVLLRSAFTSARMTPLARGRAWGALLWALVARGPVPLALGSWLLRMGVARADALLFSLGLSFALAGLTLLARSLGLSLVALRYRREPRRALAELARASLLSERLSALVIGGGLALYWALPFDALAGVLGLPRFSGGIEIFFIAGVMMVFGCVLALAPNLDLLLTPVRWASSRLGRLRHIMRIALVYPSQQRFRTGIGLALFSLVVFTMVVMDTIAASTTQSYDNLPQQAANYDIVGQPLFTPIGSPQVTVARLRSADPTVAARVADVGEATPLPLGILQPAAARAMWRYYPASELQGSLLDGVGFSLAARAPGYTSDAQVWQAVRDHPGDVVIDSSALTSTDATTLGMTPTPPATAAQFTGPPIAAGLPGSSGFESLAGQQAEQDVAAQLQQGAGGLQILSFLLNDQRSLNDFAIHLSGVARSQGSIAPTTVWVADLRGGPPRKLTIIGIVDNTHGQNYGLMGSPQTFAPVEHGLLPLGNDYYYFKLSPGSDPHAAALAIGSALIDHGFETSVLQDALLGATGARVFISRALVGLVGLTLLVGMAALAVTGSRAVVERRQQIGMLRALGFHRTHVQLIFLIESLLVGAAGVLVGLALGLLLCRNIFAVDFFEQYQSGLTLSVPWRDLADICAAALAASLLAATLPAWQAGRIAPADALRYE
ncbi:MAG TPA: FtsX-like permease family protein [Ktedonobacterales bacterium]|nr:FtsX-like permease family protein [Ktedonobacterales bacterium]